MRAALAAGWLALAAAPVLGCSPSLEDRPCGCDEAAGYTCCAATNVCLGPTEVCVDPKSWSPIPGIADGPAPIAMDDVTVFAFSQMEMKASSAGDLDKRQVNAVLPDMVIRSWGQWDLEGTDPDAFDASYFDDLRVLGIRFIGGGTATALFHDQVSDPKFDRYVTRNVAGDPVSHEDLNLREYRGSLADPEYRRLVFGYGTYQIDKGIDGLQFSDVNADYHGATTDNQGSGDLNEGFDDHHLADFNAFLLAKYPDADFQHDFPMPPGNFLRHDVPAGNLRRNFNFARYLREKGWNTLPPVKADPVADEWGHAVSGFPVHGGGTFVDNAEPYHYWREIVAELRDYAYNQYGRQIYISANGVFPYVDFVSASLYDSPEIRQTAFPLVNVAPSGTAPDFRLQGDVSVKGWLLMKRREAAKVAPLAPVVVSLDGPWIAYHGLPLGQRGDFWKLYAAEAYANGLFFAFLLKPPTSGATASRDAIIPKTANDDGTIGLFARLSAFYRGHHDLYHGTMPSPAAEDAVVATGCPATQPDCHMIAVADQVADGPRPARRIVHIVNHEYDPDPSLPSGIKAQQNVTLTIPVAMPVTKVTVASPDSDGPHDLPISSEASSDDTITVTLPTLDAYDVVIIEH